VRLGLLGGTFDPPHVGHLLAAVDAREALELDLLVFVPAGVQPFKQGHVRATGEQRLAMLRRMVAEDPCFAVDPIELERAGLSYTVETLTVFAERHPDCALFLLIGEDLAGQIGSWRDPEGIARLATVVVLTREGGEDDAGAVPLRRLATRRVDVSSTEVRARRQAGRSIRGFVTDGVADYIEAAGLYR
jgi:nicotinate-nucleotide adenylyltransferase